MTIAGGAVSYAPPPTPEPSTASRTGLEGKPPNIGTLDRKPGAAWHRPPVRQGRTVGDNQLYWGGRQINEKRTERRQEEERDARAGKLASDMELGRENLGVGGRKEGPEPSVEYST